MRKNLDYKLQSKIDNVYYKLHNNPKCAIIIIILAILAGCLLNGCTWNPCAPKPHKYLDFNDFIKCMDSASKTSEWLTERLDLDSSAFSNKDGDGDIVVKYARYGYNAKKGACMQCASIQSYAARQHNKTTGLIIEIPARGNYHAKAWIKNDDGSITVTDNELHYGSLYASFDAMIKDYDTFDGNWTIHDFKGDLINGNSNVIIQ